MTRLLPLAILLLACEPLYGDLSTPIDQSTVFRGAAETYMAGDAEMTAMVIFGEQDEANVGDVAYAEILVNGETRLYTGIYRAPEEGVVEATFDILFFIPYEYDRGATERIGSQTMELEEPLVYTGMLASGEDEVMLETEEGARTFTRLGAILPRIDVSTSEGELLVARLFNYATLVSNARVIGWGSAGLTMYIGRAGVFDGLQRGRQEVMLRDLLSPKSSFTYIDFTDMTGFRFEGTYESHTNISATGVMVGAVDFSMAPGASELPLFTGTIEYENLVVENGIPNDGFYRFTIEGEHTYDVAAADYHHVDLSGLFREVLELEGKLAVITGGAGGIGSAIARRLAREAMRLCIVDHREEPLSALAAELSAPLVIVRPFDVSEPVEWDRLASELSEEHGGASLLVNNAGINVHGPFESYRLEDIDRIVGVNLGGVIHGCRALLPQLQARSQAHIVNVSSLAGRAAFPHQTAYCATKFGVRGFSEALRMELAVDGVGVTTIMPGAVATDFLARATSYDSVVSNKMAELMRRHGTDPARVAERIVRSIRRNEAEVVVGWDARVVMAARRVAPGLLRRALAGAAAVRSRRG